MRGEVKTEKASPERRGSHFMILSLTFSVAPSGRELSAKLTEEVLTIYYLLLTTEKTPRRAFFYSSILFPAKALSSREAILPLRYS